MSTALRTIDGAEFAAKLGMIANPGAAPMLQWVPINALRVDPLYQRDISAEGRRSVLAIATGFDWRKFAPVIVAPIEGGLFAIVDGQHRTTAAAARGIEQVPCQVVVADQAAQASAFAAINGNVTKLGSTSIYFARIAAGDEEALAVAEICAASGVTVLRYAKQPKDVKAGETYAPNTLFTAYRRHGRDTLISALQCVTQTADGNPGCLNRIAIDGLCTVLGAMPAWRDAGGLLLDAFDDFAFGHELAEAKVLHLRRGGALVGVFAQRLQEFLTSALGAPASTVAEA